MLRWSQTASYRWYWRDRCMRTRQMLPRAAELISELISKLISKLISERISQTDCGSPPDKGEWGFPVQVPAVDQKKKKKRKKKESRLVAGEVRESFLIPMWKIPHVEGSLHTLTPLRCVCVCVHHMFIILCAIKHLRKDSSIFSVN